MPNRLAASRVLPTRFALVLTAIAVAALALPAISAAAPKPAVLTLKTVRWERPEPHGRDRTLRRRPLPLLLGSAELGKEC